jgi:uncharacterized protein YigE (DUF2233 family)
MLKRAVTAIAACLFTHAVYAAPRGYTIVPVDTGKAHLSLFLGNRQGKIYRTFARLADDVYAQGHALVFAMNAGMFESDGRPVGLLVIDRKTIAPLNTKHGPGNFYLMPNGVFALTSAGPVVVSTGGYETIGKDVIFATQSGPLLLKDGKINTNFDPASTSTFTRNGVCTIGKVAYFVISDVPVNFYTFARFFRDEIGCKDALYLDGSISSLYSKALGRHDHGPQLGPILGVVE